MLLMPECPEQQKSAPSGLSIRSAAISSSLPEAPEGLVIHCRTTGSFCKRPLFNYRFVLQYECNRWWFHARDHSKCGQACFASNVMQFDERTRAVNTSAGECGNQGIGRIWKSVSYMNYEHAVLYTKVFMDVWNRMVARRIARQQRA